MEIIIIGLVEVEAVLTMALVQTGLMEVSVVVVVALAINKMV